jgi:PKD repeat protein
MPHKLVIYPVLFIILVALLAPAGGISPSGDVRAAGPAQARPVVRYATRTDTSKPLRQIPPIPPVLGEIFTAHAPKRLPNREGSAAPTAGVDPVVQTSTVASTATIGTDFEGVGNVNGVLPPDTNGDIGPNHYVQVVNLSFAIYERDGNRLRGPENINTLWQGFGGPCESTNNGDPIVLYDHLADRWMMSQFALPRFPRGPFYQCIAVSQTPDPTGAWHRYEFLISNDKLNDYPKFGLWPDGYYMSINQFKCNYFFCNWAGAGAVAFERDAMLNGAPARMVYFDLYNTDPNLGGMLPADLDGPAPPAGAPNPFAQFDDSAWGYSPDQLQLWNFHVDWSNTANSTFTFDRALTTAAFDSNMCGGSRNCISQKGGTSVDAIADRLMYRLQYRSFGDHQTLVVNHTVDIDGSDHAGVRWYELRKSADDWSIYQQGTYGPDGDNRWMGSAAMNGAGAIALGYSVSSKNTYPSIRFAGRLAGDPTGEMSRGEGTIIAGGGSQSHSSGRWGDYSMLAVDPTDDCTFWYTQEYYPSSSSAGWHTRIGSFQLSSCDGTVDSPPTVTITNPADGATVSSTFLVTANASDDNGVTQVEFFLDGASLGVDSTSPYTWNWDTTTSSEGSHTIIATATDTADQTGNDSIIVTVDNINDPPAATFSYSCTDLTCTFDASGSYDSDGSIASYDWGFGDGSTGVGVNSTHAYATPGDYTVTLIVTDNDNATGTVAQTVTVSAPSAGVNVESIDPNTMASGDTINVTITGTGFANGASVTFENGSGPAPAASITAIDSTTISASVSSKSGGPRRDRVWDVRVTNPDGSAGVLPGGFIVTP